MASFNSRFRLQKSLEETGGRYVAIRMKERKRGTDPFGKIQEFLENPDFPGYFAFDETRRQADGFWTCLVGVSDPNVAFELKMKFG